jgi:hypothetical protein
VLIGIEECLSEITRTHNVVPTNTEDEWYADIVSLGTELCQLQMYQSNNEKWIRIEISFKAKILDRQKYTDTFIGYQVAKLVSQAIITQYENIRKYVSYVSEYVPYTSMPEDFSPNFMKNVSFIFSKDVLESSKDDIQKDIKDLILQIENEVELVEKDNLAKGKLIETIRSYADYKENSENPSWIIDTSQLSCPFCEEDPAEYWADIGLYHSDFISGSNKYPWMPSAISKQEGFFD